ncbi:MAG TPA: sulfur carrier protein ThiS [Gammaproteobacteria bacterium]|nr:sulfur carrier protein ThiS [Gammaproteobacteria bacterium]
MIIRVNGQPRDIPESCSAQHLITLLEMQNDKIAMEVNLEIVPRSTYSDFILKADDNVEIVRAIGGGKL